MTTNYPSNLTYLQFMIIEPLIPPAKPGGRPRIVDIWKILNGIMYRIKIGCQWEFLPKDFPPCNTVLALSTPCSLNSFSQYVEGVAIMLYSFLACSRTLGSSFFLLQKKRMQPKIHFLLLSGKVPGIYQTLHVKPVFLNFEYCS
jgi:transposase